MSTANRLTVKNFVDLPEREGIKYELDEGNLLMEASPTYLHNRVRDRIARRLAEFVEAHQLGEIIVEMDFRLGPDTVRNPDVAFVTAAHLHAIDVNRSPVEGAPALAVEVVSPSNLAQDMLKKVRQYLAAGTAVVWVVYPSFHLVEIHTSTGICHVKAPESLTEENVFQGHAFTLLLADIFREIP